MLSVDLLSSYFGYSNLISACFLLLLLTCDYLARNACLYMSIFQQRDNECGKESSTSVISAEEKSE